MVAVVAMSLSIFKVHALGVRLVLFAVIISTIFLFRHWQPSRQIELRHRNFLLALEDRNWNRVKGYLATDYSDRFGYSRETVVPDLQQVLRQFFALTIRTQGRQIDWGENEVTITEFITLQGNGPGLTDFITSEVNRLTDPWSFTWKKASFLPWDWRLAEVDNKTFRIPERRL